jgi:hypothetical protein
MLAVLSALGAPARQQSTQLQTPPAFPRYTDALVRSVGLSSSQLGPEAKSVIDQSDEAVVKGDAKIANPVVAPVAPTSALPVAAPGTEALAGNCLKFVGLGGTNDGKPKLKRWSGSKEDEYCEKNCRAGFCPETMCRCSTDPEPEPSEESAEAAVAELAVAPAVVPLVAPTPMAVAPQVAPAAPIAPEAEGLLLPNAENCPKFLGLRTEANKWAPKRHEPGHTKSKFKKVDDEYCEKNCRAGFCPKDKCRCATDPELEPSDESEEAALARRMAADPHATKQPKNDWNSPMR